MGCMLMQPVDDEESVKVTKSLFKIGRYKFELTKSGARLRPIGFYSLCCILQEIKYHSFVDKVGCS